MYRIENVQKFLKDHEGTICPVMAGLVQRKAEAASQEGAISGGQIEEILGFLAPAFIREAQGSEHIALLMPSSRTLQGSSQPPQG